MHLKIDAFYQILTICMKEITARASSGNIFCEIVVLNVYLVW